jgi:predicted nucleotidyltransferase
MLQKNNEFKVLKVFFDMPNYKFGLREISRKINLALPSVKNYLLILEKEGLIRVGEEKGNPVYFAEMDSLKFRFYKSLFIQDELFESGAIDFIWKNLFPEAIILYGSYAKGEAIENSDVDLFAVGKKSEISLEKYEKILEKKIHLIVDELNNIPKELKNNLANGIVMRGYFKILK